MSATTGSARTSVVATRDRLAAAQKTPRGVSWYSVAVNRPLGRWLAAAAYVAGLSPNVVTIMSGTVSLAAVAVLALASPSVPVGIIVALLLVLGFALDSADGQLARLTGKGSLAGEWLDHMVDAAVKVTLHGAVLVAFWRSGRDDRLLALPMAYQLVALLLFFGGTLVLALRKGSPSGPQPASRVRALALLPVDHGVLCAAFLFWGWQTGFTWIYAFLCAATAAFLLMFLAKWFKELS